MYRCVSADSRRANRFKFNYSRLKQFYGFRLFFDGFL
jgi:hypothetical protein